MLTLAQDGWPPRTDIDRRIATFRRRLLNDKIQAEALRKYTSAARHFLGFLSHIGIAAEDVNPEHVTALLETQRKAYRRRYQRETSDLSIWKQRYVTGIRRFLRFAKGRWPPPARRDVELDEYKKPLADRGICSKTICDYGLHVRIFLDYLNTKNKRVEEVRPDNVEAFHYDRHLFRPPIEFRNGCAVLPEGSGLGVSSVARA